jgi:hypothetical protein
MTLQEQYNSIKSGNGNKDQFLKQARSLFPQYFNQYTDFNTAANVLKSKQVISEAAGGVVSKGFDIYNWKKILAEEVKAEEKETSKEVKDKQAHAYNNSDTKNADNVNFNEIMKGFYAEMRDEKNAGKTGDELKAMVVKNLAKDPLHYTKDGMFGVKGLGYTDEAPGLGQPKEPKGKHKASGYGDLDTEVKIKEPKSNVQDSLGDKEAETSMPRKVKEMPDKGVTGVEKKIKLQEGNLGHNETWSLEPEGRFWILTYSTMDGKKEKTFNSEDEAKNWIKQNLDENEEQDQKITISGIEKAISMLKSELRNNNVDFKTDGNTVITNNSPKLRTAVKMVRERIGIQSINTNENILKENEDAIYDQMADLEYDLMMADTDERKAEIEAKLRALESGLQEAKGGGNYGMMTIATQGGGGGKRFIPQNLALPGRIFNRFANSQSMKDLMVHDNENEILYVSGVLYNNLMKGANNPYILGLIKDIPQQVKPLLTKSENYGMPTDGNKNDILKNRNFKQYFPFKAPVKMATEDETNKDGTKKYWNKGDLVLPNLNALKENEDLEKPIQEQKVRSLIRSIINEELKASNSKEQKVRSLIRNINPDTQYKSGGEGFQIKGY